MQEDTAKTLMALKSALGSEMSKAQLAQLLFKDSNSTFHQSSSAISGITAYDLEAPALSLYPVNTPLRNSIPRVGGGTGIQANWRAITAINSTGVLPGVSSGHRGAVIQVTTQDYTASFKGLAAEVNTDWEAQYAAKGFDDPRSLATLSGLRSLMLSEELVILGGNSSAPLNGGNATPTPNVTDAGGGSGTLVNNTSYSVICVALTLFGYRYGTVAGGIRGQVVRPNADNSSDTMGGGSGKVSANTLHTTGNSPASATYTLMASLTTAVLGAVGYAWFVSATAGSEKLVAITTAPTVAIGALAASGAQLASSLGTTDNSTDSFVFDGLITQAAKAGSNAYTLALGTALTGDGAGGVPAIDAMLKDRWDNYQLGFTDLWFGSQVAQDLGVHITSGSTTAAMRFNVSLSMEAIAGGIAVATYRNKYSMDGAQDVKLHLHPNMPGGIILGTARTIPYPLSGVGNVYQMRTRQEYNQIDWPLRTRMWESGVYVDEVLQHYAPFSMGLLYDVRAG